MPVADAQHIEGPEGGGAGKLRPRRWPISLTIGLAAMLLVALGAAWLTRERIARDVIDDYLAAKGVPATYDIVSLTPDRQVIARLVIGDPVRPDLTVERLTITLGIGWRGPQVRQVRLDGARLFARLDGGKLSLGALDPLVFAGTGKPPALPAISVTIRDARALVTGPYGRIGVKLEGAGRLDDGFAGTLAATAPGIGRPACRAASATLYGRLATVDGAAAFDGPLRLGEIACGAARLARADIGTRLRLAADFASATGDLRLKGRGLAAAEIGSAGLTGTARAKWSQQRLAIGHDLALTGVTGPHGRLARLAAEGSWRGAADGSGGQWEGSLRGSGFAPAPALAARLASAEHSLAGTLLAPLLGKARTSLTRALDGASLRAEAVIRHKGDTASLAIPEARLATRRGSTVLALSRGAASLGPQGLAGLGGHVLAGGEGLPGLNARIAQDKAGGWSLRMAMADYVAGPNRLAIARLAVTAGPDGTLRLAGLVRASGDLPGGAVRDLALPIEGTYAAPRGLMLGTRCTPVSYASLTLSGLVLGPQSLTLCPESRGPILAYGDSLRLAALSGPVMLAGRLGESPAMITADKVALRYPQPFAVENLGLNIGTGRSEVRLAAASITGRLAENPGGSFAGASARLGAVPFDLDRMAGRWTFGDGRLALDGGTFTLSDRPADGTAARFVPLAADKARLTLADGRITADALLRHPASGREVAGVAIVHDLAESAGSARLTVPGLVFDKGFQPDDLTPLAKGVVALARGTITGTGRVDWRGETVTSSGTFGSDGFDFAAAFGPVRGAAGRITFTDLVGLTTAPDQVVRIAAINPGVEVLGGTVRFALTDGTRLALGDARFPFMGGSLVMRPLVMELGAAEERRYVFDIVGLDAAHFVSQMELANMAATGIFDGTVPLVFDAAGRGRIEDGLLVARAGGGNVSYLGELTYENLGTMANYAFAALRSLDYRQMRVRLGGELDGEIITSFAFDGVRQGEGARRSFVTRRLANLPIQFRINVRSQNFYQLSTMVRSFWDARYIPDPRALGLIGQENDRLVPIDSPVQPPESQKRP